MTPDLLLYLDEPATLPWPDLPPPSIPILVVEPGPDSPLVAMIRAALEAAPEAR